MATAATALWITGWYICAVVSNLTLKAYLNVVPSLAHVVGATSAAFAVAAAPCAITFLRGSGDVTTSAAPTTKTLLARLRVELTRDALLVGVLHALATILTNVSILAGTLAYAHTIKATEPIFTSLLSRQLLNERLPWTAHAAIFVVVGGVILTSFSEGELSGVGLATALAANLFSAARAVIFKRAYGHESAADAFARMSLVATLLVTPLLALVSTVLPTIPLSPKAAAAIAHAQLLAPDGATGLAITPKLAWLLSVSSVTSAGYFACSFHVLTLMHAVSHALVNVMKRVIIILTSMMLFRTPATIVNIVGIFIANVGIEREYGGLSG
jgi:solute carrier family 35, member E1